MPTAMQKDNPTAVPESIKKGVNLADIIAFVTRSLGSLKKIIPKNLSTPNQTTQDDTNEIDIIINLFRMMVEKQKIAKFSNHFIKALITLMQKWELQDKHTFAQHLYALLLQIFAYQFTAQNEDKIAATFYFARHNLINKKPNALSILDNLHTTNTGAFEKLITAELQHTYKRAIKLKEFAYVSQIIKFADAYFKQIHKPQAMLAFSILFLQHLEKNKLLLLAKDHLNNIFLDLVTPQTISTTGFKLIQRVADILFENKEYLPALITYQKIWGALKQAAEPGMNSTLSTVLLNIKYCASELGMEEKINTSSQHIPLNQNQIMSNLSDASLRHQQYLSGFHRLPSELIPTCNQEQLYEISSAFTNHYLEGDKFNHPQSSLDMSSGNGAFETYDPIDSITKEDEDMTSYDYSSIHSKELETIKKYLKHHRIVSEKMSLQRSNILVGNGSTQLYDITLKKLFRDHPNTIGKNILLIPSPSYGLFVPQVYQNGGGVRTIPLLAANDYKLTSVQLNGAIIETNDRLFRESLPELNYQYKTYLSKIKALGIDTTQLPLSFDEEKITRTELQQRLNTIAETVMTEVKQTKGLAQKQAVFGNTVIPPIPRIAEVLGFFHCNIHNPTGKIYSQDEVTALDVIRRKHDIMVIEDLAHHELAFSKETPLGYFGNTELKPRKQVTLLSLSKAYCAPAWRVGVAYASSDFAFSPGNTNTQGHNNKFRSGYNGLEENLFSQTVFISPYQMKTISHAFEIESDDKTMYLDKNNTEYTLRLTLFQALIAGITSVKTPKEASNIIQIVKRNHVHALTQLYYGVPGLRLLTLPQGSFFVLLDFSNFVGKYIGQTQLKAPVDFAEALKNLVNICTITGEGMLTTDLPIVRISLSVERSELMQCAERFAEFVTYITDKPQLSQSPQPLLTCATLSSLAEAKSHAFFKSPEATPKSSNNKTADIGPKL